MSRFIKFAAVFCAAFLVACSSGGDGGGGSSPASPTAAEPPVVEINPSFQFFPDDFFSSGYTETYQLSGSDTVGGTYTATFITTTLPQSTFMGLPVIPIKLQLEIKDTVTNASFARTSTGYFSTDSGNRMYLGYIASSGDTFTALPVSVIPQSATIDLSGFVGRYTVPSLSHDVTIEWQLTSADAGLANLEIDWLVQGAPNQWSGKGSYVIDKTGHRKALTLVATIHYPDGDVSVTLSGNRQ